MKNISTITGESIPGKHFAVVFRQTSPATQKCNRDRITSVPLYFTFNQPMVVIYIDGIFRSTVISINIDSDDVSSTVFSFPQASKIQRKRDENVVLKIKFRMDLNISLLSVSTCVIAAPENFKLQRIFSKHEQKRNYPNPSRKIPIFELLKVLPTLIRVLENVSTWGTFLKQLTVGYLGNGLANYGKQQTSLKLLDRDTLQINKTILEKCKNAKI